MGNHTSFVILLTYLYLPKLSINNIKQTLLKSGVTFFNLHRMEKGYFPTSLIKFQVDTSKRDISYLTNKNIGNRIYIFILEEQFKFFLVEGELCSCLCSHLHRMSSQFVLYDNDKRMIC